MCVHQRKGHLGVEVGEVDDQVFDHIPAPAGQTLSPNKQASKQQQQNMVQSTWQAQQ